MKKEYHKGWDYYIDHRVGEAKQGDRYCAVCNVEMILEKDQYGPTSSMGAMFGSKHHYDAFKCPNSGEEWHNHLLKLRQEHEKLVSRELKALVEKEIKEYIDEHCN